MFLNSKQKRQKKRKEKEKRKQKIQSHIIINSSLYKRDPKTVPNPGSIVRGLHHSLCFFVCYTLLYCNTVSLINKQTHQRTKEGNISVDY